MDLIEEVFKQLNAKGPESPEVQALLRTIHDTQPDKEAIARALVSNWRKEKPSVLPALNRTQWTAVGGGVGLVALLPFLPSLLQWAQLNIPLPVIKSPIALLFVIALVGAIAGAGYSIYCNRGIVLPTFQAKAGQLTLTRFGILNEIGVGAIAAVTTVWLATIGLTPPVTTAAGTPVVASVPATP